MKKSSLTLAGSLVFFLILSALLVQAPAGNPSSAVLQKPTVGGVPKDLAELEKFYKETKFDKLPSFPAGFSFQDYFKFTKNDRFTLAGPPPLTIAKGALDGIVSGNKFSLKVGTGDPVAVVKAGAQEFKDIPPGSKISFDGKVLSLVLPDGKRAQLDEKAGGSAEVSGDQRNGFIVKGDFKGPALLGDQTVQGNAEFNSKTSIIKGFKDTIVKDPNSGTYKFLSDGYLDFSRPALPSFEGRFRLDTNDKTPRHLEIAGKGVFDSVGGVVSFYSSGFLRDLDLGVEGRQRDQYQVFSVVLEKTTRLKSKNWMVIAPGVGFKITKPRIDTDKIAQEIFALENNLPPGVMTEFRAAMAGDRDVSKGTVLGELVKEGKAGLIGPLAELDDAFSKQGPFMRAIRDGKAPIEAYMDLSEKQRAALREIFPPESMSKIMKGLSRYTGTMESVPVADVRVFGDLDGSYQMGKDGAWTTFKVDQGRVKVDQVAGKRELLPIRFFPGSAADPLTVIDGGGARNSVGSIKIVSGSWKGWESAQGPLPSAPAAPTPSPPPGVPTLEAAQEVAVASPAPVKPSSPSKTKMTPEEWNAANFEKYGREALDIVKSDPALAKDYADIFKDGKPDVGLIRELQGVIGMSEGDQDGKIGPRTLQALKGDVEVKKSGINPAAARSYKAQSDADGEATAALPSTASERLLALRVKRAWERWDDSDDASSENYEKYLAYLEKTHPGLRVDRDSGEVEGFPGRRASSPRDSLAEGVGAARSDLMRDVYLSNPERAREVDAALSEAQKAMKGSGSMLLEDAYDVSRRLSHATGGVEMDAAALVSSSDKEGLSVKEAGQIRGLVGVLADPEIVGRVRDNDLKDIASQAGNIGSIGTIMDKASRIKEKLDAGKSLTPGEIQLARLLKEPQTTAALENLGRLDFGPQFNDVVAQVKENVRGVRSYDVERLAKPNPMGVGNVYQTFQRLGLSREDIPPGMTVGDAARAGLAMNMDVRESSATGLIPLMHLGLYHGRSVMIESADGRGRIAATLSDDGRRVTYQDIADPRDFEGSKIITIDFNRLPLPERDKRVMSLPSGPVRNAAMRAALAEFGNKPDLPEVEPVRQSRVLGPAARDAPPGPTAQMDVARLIEDDVVRVSGLTRQGIRQFLGSKNEIDASKVLLPGNLLRLAERYGYDEERVLREVHRVTERRGIDPSIREFVREARSRSR